MAGIAVSDSALYQCPICHEDYQDPKVLPCFHVACKNCVLFWLDSHDETECPICRFPILSGPTESADQPKSSARLTTLVEGLPSDLLKTSLAKGHQILSAPRVCALCSGSSSNSRSSGNSSKTMFYCFECEVQMCRFCYDHHQRLPVTAKHNVWAMESLTPEDFGRHFQSHCVTHKDKMAVLFCCSHRELVCTLCVATNHRACPEVKVITHVANEKRQELEELVHNLKTIEKTFVKKVQSRNTILKKQRKEVNQLFDQLHQNLKEKQKEVHESMEKEEEQNAQGERLAGQGLKFLADTAGQLVRQGSDSLVLQMGQRVAQDTESCMTMVRRMDLLPTPQSYLQARRDVQSVLSEWASKFGEESSLTTTETPSSPIKRAASIPSLFTESPGRSGIPSLFAFDLPAEPQGTARPEPLLVGDRVKLTSRGEYLIKKDPGVGTVVAFPSRMRPAKQHCSGHGHVDVRWSNKTVKFHRYGHRNQYDVVLVSTDPDTDH